MAIELCQRGHAFTEENTYRWGDQRSCLACRRMRQRARPKAPRLPVAPLIATIERRLDYLRRFGPLQERPNSVAAIGGGASKVWENMGIGQQWFARIKELDTIGIPAADRAACALGMHPTEIWPDFDRIDGMAA